MIGQTSRFFIGGIVLTSLLVSGCSSSSSSSSDSQEIYFSDYAMTINKNFTAIPLEGVDDYRLHGSVLATYSIPSPSPDFFEKNIIISQDTLGNLPFEDYVNQSLAGIKRTRGGYSDASLSNETVSCNSTNLPAQRHAFTLHRGLLGTTGQTLYFVQYFFAKSNKITILSSSTDDSNDLDALNSYMDSIRCIGS